MKSFLIGAGVLVVIAIFGWMAWKNLRVSDSELSALEHPSTFEKPDVEFVQRSPEISKTDSQDSFRFEG